MARPAERGERRIRHRDALVAGGGEARVATGDASGAADDPIGSASASLQRAVAPLERLRAATLRELGHRWPSGGGAALLDRPRLRRLRRVAGRVGTRLLAALPGLVALAAYTIAGFAIALVEEGASWANLGRLLAGLFNFTMFGPLLFVALWIGLRNAGAPRDVYRRELALDLTLPRAPRLVTGAVLIVVVFMASNVYSLLKRLLPVHGGFHWDPALADLDALLHFGIEPATALVGLLGHPLLLRALEVNYVVGWPVLTALALILICFSPRFDLKRNRYLVLYLVVLGGLGNALAALFVSAGPVFYADVTHDAARFAALTDAILGGEPMLFSTAVTRDYLWTLYQSGDIEIGTGISAFPSVHVGLSAFLALVLREVFPRLRVLLWGYVGLILVSSVLLGWHYAIDGYASLLVVLLANRLLRPLDRWAEKVDTSGC